MQDENGTGAESQPKTHRTRPSEYLNMGTSIALGVALGLIFGTVLGRVSLGLIIGAALGVAFGAVVESRRAKK
jgi:uncharacterized membrane protein